MAAFLDEILRCLAFKSDLNEFGLVGMVFAEVGTESTLTFMDGLHRDSFQKRLVNGEFWHSRREMPVRRLLNRESRLRFSRSLKWLGLEDSQCAKLVKN